VNVDTRGEHAARALRATTFDDSAVDPEPALEKLHRLHRQRMAIRGAVVVGAFAVAATAVAVVQLNGGSPDRQQPSVTADFPPLGDGFEVVASALSPGGSTEAVATYREGQSAVVLVRTAGSDTLDVAWSAPTAHERGSGDLPFPAAVHWSPDGSRLAILVGQQRRRGTAGSGPVDLTLVTVNPDGTARDIVAEVGSCRCSRLLPTLSWAGDEIAITIPDGPDQGVHREEMP
jgi:hypothetical protein